MNATDFEPLDGLLDGCRADNRLLRAVLELTYRCNFTCPHCFVHTDVSNHGHRERELTTAEWRGVLDQLAGETLVVTFTGGEVFCRNDFAEIARHARDRRFAIRVFTNASYIDDAQADLLAEIRPLQVEVSLYGATPAGYRAVAGHEIYLERSCRGVDRLIERGLRVILKSPLMQENQHEMDALVELARSRWGREIRLSVQMVQRDDRSEAPVQRRIDERWLAHYLRHHAKPSPERDRNLSAPPCNVARDYLVVSPFGDVFPCVNVKRSVGNVRERPIREIWDTAPFLHHLRGLTLADYRPHYTEEEFRRASICPGAVYRETGHAVGATSWNKFYHKVRRQTEATT